MTDLRAVNSTAAELAFRICSRSNKVDAHSLRFTSQKGLYNSLKSNCRKYCTGCDIVHLWNRGKEECYASGLLASVSLTVLYYNNSLILIHYNGSFPIHSNPTNILATRTLIILGFSRHVLSLVMNVGPVFLYLYSADQSRFVSTNNPLHSCAFAAAHRRQEVPVSSKDCQSSSDSVSHGGP